MLKWIGKRVVMNYLFNWIKRNLVRICAYIVGASIEQDLINVLTQLPPDLKQDGRVYIEWNRETLKNSLEVYRTKDPIKVLSKRVVANMDWAYFMPDDPKIFIVENGKYKR